MVAGDGGHGLEQHVVTTLRDVRGGHREGRVDRRRRVSTRAKLALEGGERPRVVRVAVLQALHGGEAQRVPDGDRLGDPHVVAGSVAGLPARVVAAEVDAEERAR